MKRYRIGLPTYINCLPVYYGLLNHNDERFELVKGTPAELNGLMRAGLLDASAVSSIEYSRNKDRYLLMPDICLNSLLKVMSVNLFSKVKLEDLGGKRIALSNTSETSHALLRIILNKFYGFDNEFCVMPPVLDEMLKENDAALVIGDEALKYLSAKKTNVYDLGKIWNERTGLEFVFAVWVFRRKFALDHPGLCADVEELFKNSLKEGLLKINSIIDVSSKMIPDVDFSEYFANLNYEFTHSCKKGLTLFYGYARELGLAPECVGLEFFDNPGIRRGNLQVPPTTSFGKKDL